ncbi:MAG: GSU2403 family nucleotidyltransferase fold protein, partial [Pseudomonadota bacterium]|nr:GSU2403 family nucleotidyltransferase fold protein [Pseudomonadota bacterium]
YLLQDVQQAAVLSGAGAVLVSVPHPARYALHKLIVAGERPASRIAKSNKDIQQAAALLAALQDQASSWQVDEAWADLMGRGPGWVPRARRGRDALTRVAPELGVDEWLA